MSTIRQYTPNVVDLEVPPEQAQFNTKEELLDIPFVKKWTDLLDFYRFSKTKYDGDEFVYLMAEYDNGRKNNIVGFITTEEDIDLPEWEKKF